MLAIELPKSSILNTPRAGWLTWWDEKWSSPHPVTRPAAFKTANLTINSVAAGNLAVRTVVQKIDN